MTFFDRPLYIWFGIAAGISLAAAVFLGLNMRRFGLKYHKICAFSALIFAVLHFLLGAWRYF